MTGHGTDITFGSGSTLVDAEAKLHVDALVLTCLLQLTFTSYVKGWPAKGGPKSVLAAGTGGCGCCAVRAVQQDVLLVFSGCCWSTEPARRDETMAAPGTLPARRLGHC